MPASKAVSKKHEEAAQPTLFTYRDADGNATAIDIATLPVLTEQDWFQETQTLFPNAEQWCIKPTGVTEDDKGRPNLTGHNIVILDAKSITNKDKRYSDRTFIVQAMMPETGKEISFATSHKVLVETVEGITGVEYATGRRFKPAQPCHVAVEFVPDGDFDGYFLFTDPQLTLTVHDE